MLGAWHLHVNASPSLVSLCILAASSFSLRRGTNSDGGDEESATFKDNGNKCNDFQGISKQGAYVFFLCETALSMSLTEDGTIRTSRIKTDPFEKKHRGLISLEVELSDVSSGSALRSLHSTFWRGCRAPILNCKLVIRQPPNNSK